MSRNTLMTFPIACCVFSLSSTLLAMEIASPVSFPPKYLCLTLDARGNVAARELCDQETRAGYSDGNCWNGLDPFQRPFGTTDYYGSGDVDLDGIITSHDATLAAGMLTTAGRGASRADVNGNGLIDTNDVSLITMAVGGSRLPSSWNDLSDLVTRGSWVSKCMARDMTDKHPYEWWWMCWNFSMQVFVHATGYTTSLLPTSYDGGHTNFNLPVYTVHVSAPNFEHMINAVLVGDDPLHFDNWYFIEPQSDAFVWPGSWSMPTGSTVIICAPTYLTFGLYVVRDIVEFHVALPRVTLVGHDSALVLHRNPQQSTLCGHGSSVTRPMILTGSPGHCLYDRNRDDLSRVTDIHIAALGSDSISGGEPLLGTAYYARLLSVQRALDGGYHVLWKGKEEYDPGVFYGKLDRAGVAVTGVTRLSRKSMAIQFGRILETPAGQVHALWLDNYEEDQPGGIFWKRRVGSTWTSPERLIPDPRGLELNPFQPNRIQQIFDACDVSGNVIDLVWGKGDSIKGMQYNGTWRSLPAFRAGGYVGGLAVASGTQSGFHVVYWLETGVLLHRYFDGVSWSPPGRIDSGSDVSSPGVMRGGDNRLLAVWTRKKDARLAVHYSVWNGSTWATPGILSSGTGLDDAWYPSIGELGDGTPVCAWFSMSDKSGSVRSATPVVDPPWVQSPQPAAAQAPGAFSILQNYPNPFNLSTTIGYGLPALTHVRVSVFNALGQRIADLQDGEQEAGYHEVLFDASNMASGVYFYRIHAGDHMLTKGCLLLR